MRVLTVVDAFRLGGAETLIAQLGRVAAQADLDLQVLSILDRGPDRSALEPMLRDVGLEPHYLGVRRTLDPTAVPRLVSFIKHSGADVVHAHLEMAMTLALPAAALAGRPGGGHLPPRAPAAVRSRRRSGTTGGRGGHPEQGGDLRLAGLVDVVRRSLPTRATGAQELDGGAQRDRPRLLQPGHRGVAPAARRPRSLRFRHPRGDAARRAAGLQGHHPRRARLAGRGRPRARGQAAAGRIGIGGSRSAQPGGRARTDRQRGVRPACAATSPRSCGPPRSPCCRRSTARTCRRC